MTSRRRRVVVVSVLAAVVLGMSGCSSGAPAPVPASALPPRTTVAAGQLPSKVLVVVEENQAAGTALRQMPYLAALGNAYGQTSSYHAVAHPSLPNYLAMAAGSTFGVTDDAGPASHPIPGPSVFDGAIAAGRSAKTYAEAMPAPCSQQSAGRYAVKHNAWAYFAGPASRGNCQHFDLPAGSPTSGPLRSDIDAGALPTLGELIPDLCHDGHDCSLGAADDWLRQWLPVVMAGPDYRAGNLTVVVTFDEDDSSGPNTVLTTVIAPTIAYVRTAAQLTHYSLSGYLAQLAGTPPQGAAASAPSLRAAFGI